ncbi:L-ascorbate metabolism protein UlaG, beta-lactamase superfamily [Lentzea fradiae]|uniref:L-ascorbate metabolism protein UlaG, beta-lactamase superfamily n=1 Tax=Lentzea fradiae TaxID=200378 RepID=A0A1G7MBW1_9PSEU|nr:MBL fold metallo-hydrolase [Lentzea fradiae]SDF59223.1 L-ascorbate metabolism protein UlaG, beta-lactamase superfamily [Lentzea fradiae]
MRVVHFGHACVLLDTGDARILIDPGTFSAGFEELTDLDAVLITHQHFDHLDTERLPALLEANPQAQFIVDEGTAPTVENAAVARPGDTFKIGGTGVRVVGGQHAIIHEDIPGIPNAGYVIGDGAFYHPGDSLFVPDEDVDVLGLPAGAPWLRTGEAVDFMRAVKPRVAVPIHEKTLSSPQMAVRFFDMLKPEGTDVRLLTPGEETAV